MNQPTNATGNIERKIEVACGLLLFFSLLLSPGVGWEFSGGGITGAMQVTNFNEQVAGGTITGTITSNVIGASTDESEPSTRLGIVRDALPPSVAYANVSSMENCTTQATFEAWATFGTDDAGVGYDCYVCPSSVSTSCDGTWSNSPTTVTAFDDGFTWTCNYTLDTTDHTLFNSTYPNGIYVWFRAVSALGAENETVSSLLAARPMEISFFYEENPSNTWSPSVGATWAQLRTYCLGEKESRFTLTGSAAETFSCFYNSTNTWWAGMWWEQGDPDVRRHRLQVPPTQSSTAMNIFIPDANVSTVHKVQVVISDDTSYFINNQSYFRVRCYINGTVETCASMVMGDDPNKEFYFSEGSFYHWRAGREDDAYQWDAGPIHITSNEERAAFIQWVDFSPNLRVSQKFIQWGYSNDFPNSRINLIYNVISGTLNSVCVECVNATGGNGTSVFSSCSTSSASTFQYDVPAEGINNTWWCGFDISHQSFPENLTDSRFLRLANDTGYKITLGSGYFDESWYARVSLALIFAVALMGTKQNGSTIALLTGITSGFVWYIGWLPLGAGGKFIIFVVAAIGIGAKMREA